jgi:hypothetical protein
LKGTIVWNSLRREKDWAHLQKEGQRYRTPRPEDHVSNEKRCSLAQMKQDGVRIGREAAVWISLGFERRGWDVRE